MEPSWVHYLGHEIVEVKQSEIDPAAWEQVSAFLQQHPSGRVIVVGEAANEKLVEWQRDASPEPCTDWGALLRWRLLPGFCAEGTCVSSKRIRSLGRPTGRTQQRKLPDELLEAPASLSRG